MALDKIKGKVRQFAVGEEVILYEIDLTPLGGVVYHFTNEVFEERLPIQFGGNTYTQIAVNVSSIEVDTQSSPARPTLSIATLGGPIAALIQQYNDLRRAKVTQYSTFTEYLDVRPDGLGGVEVNPNADSAAKIKENTFIVNRKNSANDMFAEFQLKSPADMDGARLPARICRKRWCGAKYRVEDGSGGFHYEAPVNGGCPWGNTTEDGGNYYDENDQPTTAANDRCSKQVSGCIVRFGNNAPLPFDGLPGIRGTAEV